MNTDMKSRIQETLDELLNEHLIPFPLIAHKVDLESRDEYVVPFYDSRFHSIRFSWTDCGRSLRETVRTAVLNRVSSMDSPRRGWVLAS